MAYPLDLTKGRLVGAKSVVPVAEVDLEALEVLHRGQILELVGDGTVVDSTWETSVVAPPSAEDALLEETLGVRQVRTTVWALYP